MKNKDILNALGGIDPEFIADAEKSSANRTKARKILDRE